MKQTWALLVLAPAFAQAQTMNMDEIAKALGVRCDYCHSAPRGSGQAEPKKEVARAMMAMTRDLNAKVQEATIDEIVEDQMSLASTELSTILSTAKVLPFPTVLASLLQPYMLRETNVKDICVALAKVGKIENTWGAGNRKPRDENMIRLKTTS